MQKLSFLGLCLVSTLVACHGPVSAPAGGAEPSSSALVAAPAPQPAPSSSAARIAHADPAPTPPLPSTSGDAAPAPPAPPGVAETLAKKLKEGDDVEVTGFYVHATSPSIETPGGPLSKADFERWIMEISDDHGQTRDKALYCDLPRAPAVRYGERVTLAGKLRGGRLISPCVVKAHAPA